MASEQDVGGASEGVGPAGLSMTVTDTFFVAGPWTKGTILTGELQGDGRVRVGDILVCDGQSYEIVGIEKFRRPGDEAAAGEAVGLALGTGVDRKGFEGKHLTFRRRPASGVPGRSPQGDFVPSRVDAVVNWGTRKGRTTGWGVLSFDGLTATLRADDGAVVFVELCSGLTVSTGSVDLWVVRPDGTGTSLRGLAPQEWRRSEVLALAKGGQASLIPDPGLSGPNRWWEKLMITSASASLRSKMHWRRALVTMFEARGAQRGS